ncbi:glycosyltransferase family 2 protein [Trueperella sp. LYQ143]|uniref:glycosyltransferase family 2 protein n=1 Tax=unclassified Trueperella TaxID=2630174 RepID=UPI0039834614
MGITTEIVIPVHDATRPIRRAVNSVLAASGARAIVVAHNIDPTLLDIPDGERVRVVPLSGDVERPGAAFDAGIAAGDAPWVGIMGSDDWYADGALSAMLRRARSDRADGIIAPLRYQFAKSNQIKPVTVRRRNLEAVRDRLFYRTAPLGIYRRDILADPQLRFGNRYPTGEDIRVSTQLWTAGLSLSYYWNDPAYVVGRDAQRRVTFTPRPVAVLGQPCRDLFDEPAVQVLGAEQIHALAVKIARVHIVGIAVQRDSEAMWAPDDICWLADFTRQLREIDPDVWRPLNRRDTAVLAAVESGEISQIMAAIRAWNQGASRKDRILARSLWDSLRQHDTSVRWYAAVAGVRMRSVGYGRARTE